MSRIKYRLTEKRAADRQAMANEIKSLVALHSLWTVEDEPMGLRELWLTLRGPKGLSVTIDFDGESPMPDNYCLAWHFAYDGDNDARLSDNFGRYQGSPFDAHHHRRKCTAFAAGIDTLLDKLETAMQMADSSSPFGSAFMGGENHA